MIILQIKFKKQSGMALVIVLSIAMAVMTLAVAYLKSYKDTTTVSKMQLDKIQADFFARGIQNIALFKIKQYPDFFIRSYRHKAYAERIANGETLPALSASYTPEIFTRFLGGDSTGSVRGILNHLESVDDTRIGLTEPLNISTYSTDIRVYSSDDFNQSFFEIHVTLQLQGRDLVFTNKIGVNATQTAEVN